MMYSWGWLDDLRRDVHQAVRDLRRSLGFAATVVVILALGIGANTVMFNILHHLLIQPLPYPDAGAIVRITEVMRTSSSRIRSLSLLKIIDEAESFEQVAAYESYDVEWTGPEGAVALRAARVSPALFPLLRAQPHLGRLFMEGEAREVADRVVLLSHGAWTRRFGSDPDIVGAVISLDDAPHVVVGVLTEGFHFPSPDEELWTPQVISGFLRVEQLPDGGSRLSASFSFLMALGRLRPGVSAVQATAEVRTILGRGARAGRSRDGGRPRIYARIVRLQDEMNREYRPALLALTAATALVLLVACINVAGLLVARGVRRQRALAICAALGAGRGRLVRQLLAECVVLSLAGGALGLAVTVLVLAGLPAVVPGNVARLDGVRVDGLGLVFAFALSVVVGVAFGVVPAFQRFSSTRALHGGSGQPAGGFRLRRSNRTRAALVAVQTGLSVMLLVGAGLLLRSFVGLVMVDRGYDPTDVISARIRNPEAGGGAGAPAPGGADSASESRFRAALVEAMTRLQRLSAVESVGLSSGLPLTPGGMRLSSAQIAGRSTSEDPNDRLSVQLQWASPGYFEAMQLRFLSGRVFTRRDGLGGRQVAVVNETFAQRLGGVEQALGQRVRFGSGRAGNDRWWEVVGVVADVRYEGLAPTEPRAEAFVPVQQAEVARRIGEDSFVTVRTTGGDSLAVVPFLREAVAEAHGGASIDDVATMDARLSTAVAQPRFYAAVVGFFAGLALLLTAAGIYGLLNYTVAQRRAEIGVRMALGAQRRDVLALVVKQGAKLVAGGAAAGLATAALSSRVLEGFLFGVATDDRLTFAAAPLVLVAVALVACWLPARRATRVDPTEALRYE